MKPGDSFNGKRIRAITPFAGNTYKLVFDDGSHGYANITDQIGQGSAAQPKEGLPEQDFEIDNYMKSKAIPVDDSLDPNSVLREGEFEDYMSQYMKRPSDYANDESSGLPKKKGI